MSCHCLSRIQADLMDSRRTTVGFLPRNPRLPMFRVDLTALAPELVASIREQARGAAAAAASGPNSSPVRTPGKKPAVVVNEAVGRSKLYLLTFIDWPETSTLPLGKIEAELGFAGEVRRSPYQHHASCSPRTHSITGLRHLLPRAGACAQIEPETEAILLENSVDFSEFAEDALACLPPTPWTITPVRPFFICFSIRLCAHARRASPVTAPCPLQDVLQKRRDVRDWRIVSIDPTTARDLDDALSVRPLDNGHFEVGIHIADVSHFVAEGSALDVAARSRATTVYMIQRAVPMLPRLLCEVRRRSQADPEPSPHRTRLRHPSQPPPSLSPVSKPADRLIT